MPNFAFRMPNYFLMKFKNRNSDDNVTQTFGLSFKTKEEMIAAVKILGNIGLSENKSPQGVKLEDNSFRVIADNTIEVGTAAMTHITENTFMAQDPLSYGDLVVDETDPLFNKQGNECVYLKFTSQQEMEAAINRFEELGISRISKRLILNEQSASYNVARFLQFHVELSIQAIQSIDKARIDKSNSRMNELQKLLPHTKKEEKAPVPTDPPTLVHKPKTIDKKSDPFPYGTTTKFEHRPFCVYRVFKDAKEMEAAMARFEELGISKTQNKGIPDEPNKVYRVTDNPLTVEISKTAQTEIEHAIVAQQCKSRFHVFPATLLTDTAELQDKYKSYKGDLLKAHILNNFQESLKGIRDPEKLQETINEFKTKNEYKTLQTGQDIATRVLNLQTTSIKKFEEICKKAEEDLGEAFSEQKTNNTNS